MKFRKTKRGKRTKKVNRRRRKTYKIKGGTKANLELNKLECKEQNINEDPGCINHCGINRTGSSSIANEPSNTCVRDLSVEFLTDDLYKVGKDRIIKENSIELVEPDGEISFSDTISSCTAVTVVFNNNYKIGLHIGLAFYTKEEDENGLNAFGAGTAPPAIVTLVNMIDKIKELYDPTKEINGENIKSIYIFSNDYDIYSYINESKEYLINELRCITYKCNGIADNQKIKEILTKNLNVPNDFLLVVHNGIDVSTGNRGDYLLITRDGNVKAKYSSEKDPEIIPTPSTIPYAKENNEFKWPAVDR